MEPTSGTRPLGAQRLPWWEIEVQEKVSAGAGGRGRAAGKARKAVAAPLLTIWAGVEECLALENENPFFRACYERRFGCLKTGILGLTLPFIHSGALSGSAHRSQSGREPGVFNELQGGQRDWEKMSKINSKR